MDKNTIKQRVRAKFNGMKFRGTSDMTCSAIDEVIDNLETGGGFLDAALLYSTSRRLPISSTSVGGFIIPVGDSRNPYDSGMWKNGINYVYSLTNISNYAGGIVHINGSIQNPIRIAFLKDDYYEDSQMAHFCEGYNDALKFEDSIDVTIPLDCMYLATCIKWAGNDINNNISVSQNVVKNLSQRIEKISDFTSIIPDWACTNSRGVSLSSDGNKNITATVIDKTLKARVYLDLNEVPDNTRVHIKYNYTINDSAPKMPTLGYGTAADGDWSSLYDVNNIVTYSYDGKCDVTFVKTARYIFFAGNQYASGDVITISGVEIYMIQDINSIITNTTNLLSYSPSVNSLIDFTPYSHERLMSLSPGTKSGQGCAVYGDYFFQLYSNDSSTITLYNLDTKVKIQDITVTGITNTRAHGNTATFGKKYENSDPFPLLYVPSGYAKTTTSTEYQIYVLRFTESSGVYSASVIQTITVDYNKASSWIEAVVDTDLERLWIKSGSDWKCYTLPDTSSATITINEETNKVYSFVLPPWNYTTGKSSAQGHIYYKGKIIFASGVPSYADEGPEACCIVVINTRTMCRESIIWLSDIGLTNGTDNTYEPEGVFVRNNELYICFRTFIERIYK